MRKNNLTRIEISKDLNKKKGFSVLLSKKILDDLIKILSLCIKKDNLILMNIGSFRLLNKNERVGRNPKTSETFKISARSSISFKASKKLIKDLNNG